MLVLPASYSGWFLTFAVRRAAVPLRHLSGLSATHRLNFHSLKNALLDQPGEGSVSTVTAYAGVLALLPNLGERCLALAIGVQRVDDGQRPRLVVLLMPRF